jgi:single-stranded-DNA-specific exonuclease
MPPTTPPSPPLDHAQPRAASAFIEPKLLGRKRTDSGRDAPIRGIQALWLPRPSPRSSHNNAPPAARSSAPLIARLLAARGLSPGPASDAFLNPSLKQLHDPSLMGGLDRSAHRLLHAARAREPIVIYGDYDVDGISATAILYHTLRAIAPDARVTTYVPHRLEEGYGLNASSIAELCAGGARVIVSVDCGVTAVWPAKVARDAGVDLIITDHHNLPAPDDTGSIQLPDAYAIVHPRLTDETHPTPYPYPELCGAGVAFKLAWRMLTLHAGATRLPDDLRDLLLDLLGLASLGVIADVVPLVDENRVMARFGLTKVKHSAIPGLRALIEASNLSSDRVREEDVGFRIAPRLNACGRMGHAREAVELLTTATGPRAIEIAQQLSRMNEQRRATEREIFEHACDLAHREGMTEPDRRAIVLAHEDWHPGVVGIVCSRLVERFHRPTILMRRHDGQCHGSGRSVPGFSLHAALAACASTLTQYGGHDMAAGVRLEASRLDDFRDEFIARANQAITPDDLVAKLHYDAIAHPGELTVASVTDLRRLAPFGRDNPSVRVRIEGLRIAARPELLGSTNRHLSMHVRDDRGRTLRAIAWGWGEHVERFRMGMGVELLATPTLNHWQGSTSVQLEVADARIEGT